MAKIDRESYFDLPVSDQADVLQSLAPVMGRRAEILEKDIWLCQVLGILFQLPCRKPMAFKGGTSLSKVYKAIDRFSEDIDVTVDYRTRPQPRIADCAGVRVVCGTHLLGEGYADSRRVPLPEPETQC